MGDRSAALRNIAKAKDTAQQSDAQAPQLTYQLVAGSTQIDPTLADGWLDTASLNEQLGAIDGAIGCYRRALELPDGEQEGDMNAEKRAKALVSMAHLLQRVGKIDEAFEALDEAVDLDPNIARLWLNLSICHGTDGGTDLALECARKAYDLDPEDVHVEMGLAFALLFAGKYAEGLKHFEARFPYKLKSFLSYPYPQWKGEEGKSIYLVADQGIGDTLSFSRFVEMAAKRAKFVHMAVQPELVRLFAASFQHIPNKNIVPLPCPWPPAECWTTFMSLPTALGLTDDEIINAPNIRVPKFHAPTTSWKSTDRKLHVGVAWSGSPAADHNKWRSFPLDHLLDLYRVPGLQLYSLQVGSEAQQLHAAGAATLLRDLSPLIRDVTDSLALLEHLDLVISVESALGHICSLVRRECWIPYSYHGRDFRIGYDGQNRLWSPHHRIFKQANDARWEPVFEEIERALAERLSSDCGEAAK